MQIKEVKELVKGLELVGMTGAKIMSDGKVDTSDFGAVIGLLTEFNVLIDAVKGINEIPAEIKDVDQAELVELGTILYGAVKNIKDAYKA